MSNEYERLVVSVWLPLGINNLSALSEQIKNYLKTNQKKLRYSGWDGQVQLNDYYLTFVLRFNSRYEKLNPAILILEVRYYGWGYIEYSLTLENHEGTPKMLTPNFVNENMHSLLEKSVEIVSGTLLEHQKNFLGNVLFGNGVLSIETYLEAARDNQLHNGIMDAADDEEIRQGFRFEANQLEAITPSEILLRRESDILVKTFILSHSDSLQAPVAYDDIDGDFGAFTESLQKQYVRGRHRSSLLILKNGAEFSQDFTRLICSTNSIIRFLRFLINVMVFTRKQISLLRRALLERRGIRFGHEIPKLIEEAEQEHLQGYALYLISRIPLLEEVVEYLKEAQGKIAHWQYSAQSDIENNLQMELAQTKEYMNDLALTAIRVIGGLSDEIKSVRELIEIYDEEESYKVSTKIEGLLDAIRGIQSDIQKSSQAQTTMQKRSLETQFIQSEFARSSENRQRAGRVVTQLTGAIAVASVSATAIKNITESLSALFVNIPKWLINGTNTILPLILGVVGWSVVSNFLSQTRRYGDTIEITIPLKNQIFDENELIQKRFRDEEGNVSERHLDRLRIEGNTHRVTWEDEIIGSSRNRQLLRPSSKANALNKVFATLEYIKIGNSSFLTSLMMSAEKSQDEKSMLDLKRKIMQLAAERLHTICSKDREGNELSTGYWLEQIEQALVTNGQEAG
jgi:hypothetical protein